MGPQYPELQRDAGRITTTAVNEEASFLQTLRTGTQIFDVAVGGRAPHRRRRSCPGDKAFELHDTYGFPIDLTLEMAARAGPRGRRAGLPPPDEGAAGAGQGRRPRPQGRRHPADRVPRRCSTAPGSPSFTGYTEIATEGTVRRAAEGRRRGARRRAGRRGRDHPGPHAVLRRGRRPARRPRHDPAARRRRGRGVRRAVAGARTVRPPGHGHRRRVHRGRSRAGPGRRRAAQRDHPRAHRDPHDPPGVPRDAGRDRHPDGLGERARPAALRLPQHRTRPADGAGRRRGAGQRGARGRPGRQRPGHEAGRGDRDGRDGAVRREVRRQRAGRVGRRLGARAVRRHARPAQRPARGWSSSCPRAASAPGCAASRPWSAPTPTGSWPAST